MEIVCGQCRKPYVQAVRRQGFLDRLLSLVSTYPFRCQVCGYRFHLMQWGVHYIEQDVDRRQYRRRPVRMDAWLVNEQGERGGVVTDIALDGCTVETNAPLHKGDLLSVKLDALDDEPNVMIEAAIVRSVQGVHLGVEFLRLTKHEEVRLSKFMQNLWLEGTQIARRSH